MEDGHRQRRISNGGYTRDRGAAERDRGRYSRNGRGRARERERERPRGGGRGKGDYVSGMPMKTPVILANPKRQEQAIAPGAVSIMQRDSGSSHHTLSPTTHKSSPGLLPTPTEPLPSSPRHPQPPAPMVLRSRSDRDEQKQFYRSLPRRDGPSSGPSNYTPLQPTSRGGRERDPSVLSRPDHSVFLSQAGEMSHCVKLVDKNWHWEDRGMDSLLEQGDFLVVGALGNQAVGKSTIMSLLAGTRTGSGKPFMFRTQSKEVYESGGYQTTGIDMLVTGERVVLLDTQPILSETMLDQFTQNQTLVPPGLNPETYMEILSLQLAIFLFTVCHVVVVVVDTMETNDNIFKFLRTAERMKATCVTVSPDLPLDLGEKQAGLAHLPQLVFVLNHATPEDFQPLAIREMHAVITENFQGSKTPVSSGVSLARSGLVPIGRGFPTRKPPSRSPGEVDMGEVNLHLVPTNQNITDTYGTHCASPSERIDSGLNPILSLLPMFTGYPSFQLLIETLRNQIFAMPRPPLRRTAQQQLTEREWFDYARRVWLTLKKSDLFTEYNHILQSTSPD